MSWYIKAVRGQRAKRLAAMSDEWIRNCINAHGNSIKKSGTAMGIANLALADEIRRRNMRFFSDDKKKVLSGFSTPELLRLYITNHRNSTDLAEILGVSMWTIRREFKRRGISMVGNQGKRKVSWSYEMLHRLYHGENKSINEIARLYEITPSAVHQQLIKYGVPRRAAVCPADRQRRVNTPFGQRWAPVDPDNPLSFAWKRKKAVGQQDSP